MTHDEFAIGATVRHRLFGDGEVVKVRPGVAAIRFADGAMREFALAIAVPGGHLRLTGAAHPLVARLLAVALPRGLTVTALCAELTISSYSWHQLKAMGHAGPRVTEKCETWLTAQAARPAARARRAFTVHAVRGSKTRERRA